MRYSAVISIVCIVGGCLSLLIPILLHAQPLLDEPFVCGGEYNEYRLTSHGQAKVAGGRPSRLTALVIFAKFAGEAPEDSLSPAYADDLFDPDLPGSLSHFYQAMSFGQFEIEGTVLPKRYASLHGASYYVSSDTSVSRGKFGLFNREILQQVDREVDFGRLDNDGPDGVPNSGDDDGYADFVFINLRSIVEGFFESIGTGMASLGLKEPYVTDDSSALGGFIQVRDGATERVWSFAHAVGVMAHELGHWLGLPDLYDTSLWTEVPPEEDSAGIGSWGLMGRGALGWHGNDGPVPFCAWSREQLGWIGEDHANLVVVDRPMRDVVIEDVEVGGKVYKMPISEEEYFLIEHRRASGGYYNRSMPSDGLLIWHIGSGSSNEDEQRKRVDLECADGRYADRGYPGGAIPDQVIGGDNLDFWAHDEGYRDAHRGNLGDATDVFEGVQYTAFGPYTNPSSAGIDGRYTGHRVERIRRVGNRMMADLLPGPGRLILLFGSIEDGLSEKTSGDGNGVIDPGETVQLYVGLINKGLTGTYSVQAVLRTGDPFVTMVDSTVEYGDVLPGEKSDGWFRFTVSPDAPVSDHVVVFTLEMRDGPGNQWRESLTRLIGTRGALTVYEVPFGSPESCAACHRVKAGATLISYEILDRSTDPGISEVLFGNGDGVANPGELVGIRPLVGYGGPEAPRPRWIKLRSDDPFVRDAGGGLLRQHRILSMYGGLDRYSVGDEVLRVFVASETPSGYAASLSLTIGAQDGTELANVPIRLEIQGSDAMPPYVEGVEKSPTGLQFHVGDPLTFRCWFYGGEKPKRVQLKVIAVPDGGEIALLDMVDDGEHDDYGEDDGVYAVTWTIPLASAFEGGIVAEDAFGNRGETPLGFGWTSAPFEVNAPVLLYDSIPPGTESVYADVLHAKDIPYDLWNLYYAGSRGVVDVVPHYADGLVIVAQDVPFNEVLFGNYLDEGGHLFVACRIPGDTFLQRYIYIQDRWWSPGQFGMLEGVEEDPITDGLPPLQSDLWDPLVPTFPATSIVKDMSGRCYGVKVRAARYRAVYLSFDVEGIKDVETRETLLHRIIGWLVRTIREGDHPTGVEEEGKESVPTTYVLHSNVPNPFNTRTTIGYEVPVDTRITLCIYSISGQKIRTLLSGPHSAGRYTVLWDGTDEEGKAVGSGVYLYRLVAEGFRSTRRMVLIR